MESEFTVQTPTFTGPLDLLLQLIEKRKLFIGDVSLATVTEDFLEHVNTMSSFPVHSVAHFLVVASTLLLIKSRSLLPYLSLTEEETKDVEDLERRLKLYKEVRRLSANIKELFGKQFLFTAGAHTPVKAVFAPHETVTVPAILHAAKEIISTFPPFENTPHAVVEKILSLETMIEELTVRIQEGIQLTFSEMSSKEGSTDKEQRLNMIVSFLALLELVKKDIVSVQQKATFDEIAVAKT